MKQIKPKCLWDRYTKSNAEGKKEIEKSVTDIIVDTYYDMNEAELRYKFISRLLIGYFDDLINYMNSKQGKV